MRKPHEKRNEVQLHGISDKISG